MSRAKDCIQVQLGEEWRKRMDRALARIRRRHTGPASTMLTRSSVGKAAILPEIEALERLADDIEKM